MSLSKGELEGAHPRAHRDPAIVEHVRKSDFFLGPEEWLRDVNNLEVIKVVISASRYPKTF